MAYDVLDGAILELGIAIDYLGEPWLRPIVHAEDRRKVALTSNGLKGVPIFP